MGLYCIVKECKSTKYHHVLRNQENKTNIAYFKFPSNASLKKKWIEALVTLNNQENASNCAKTGKICALHFSQDCIEHRGYSQYRLKPNVVPSIFPHALQNSMEISTTSNNFNVTQSITDKVCDAIQQSESMIPDSFESNDEVMDEPGKELPEKIVYDDLMKNNDVTETNAETNKHAICDIPNISCETPEKKTIDELEVKLSEEIIYENLSTKSNVMEVSAETDKNVHTICETSKKKIRYPGDVKSPILDNMTPRTMSQYVRVLRKTCEKKNKIIKRLRTEQHRYKKKISSLKQLLSELQQKCQLSSRSSDIIRFCRIKACKKIEMPYMFAIIK